MPLRIYGATDQGLVRTSNQDSHFFSPDFGIVVVSDGMGGHRGGEIASSLVVKGLKEAYLSSNQILVEHVGSFLDEVLRNINADILARADADENLKGMGATVNYLQFAGGVLAIGHAGDSRTYLVRRHRVLSGDETCSLWQLTIDHNVGVFLERGLLNLGPAQKKGLSERQKSRLMRGMGVTGDLKADLYMRTLVEGDVFLTCSDGLHGYVPESAILATLCEGELAEAPRRLIDLVKKAGAPDNVTVVISAWAQSEEPLREPLGNGHDPAPFLVRFPNGDIVGPSSAEPIVRKMLTSEIPTDAEVSARGMPWVFFRDSRRLWDLYPEFDTGAVRMHFSRVIPMSEVGSLVPEDAPFADSRTRKAVAIWILGAVVAFGILILFLMTLSQYYSLRDSVQ